MATFSRLLPSSFSESWVHLCADMHLEYLYLYGHDKVGRHAGVFSAFLANSK